MIQGPREVQDIMEHEEIQVSQGNLVEEANLDIQDLWVIRVSLDSMDPMGRKETLDLVLALQEGRVEKAFQDHKGGKVNRHMVK